MSRARCGSMELLVVWSLMVESGGRACVSTKTKVDGNLKAGNEYVVITDATSMHHGPPDSLVLIRWKH